MNGISGKVVPQSHGLNLDSIESGSHGFQEWLVNGLYVPCLDLELDQTNKYTGLESNGLLQFEPYFKKQNKTKITKYLILNFNKKININSKLN